jgi:hypothetical protein
MKGTDMDLSIEAIEADFASAERTLGRPEAAIYMQRAQVRATLRAMQAAADPIQDLLTPIASERVNREDIMITTTAYGSNYDVPKVASEQDRIQAAAHLLGLNPDDLAARLSPTAGTVPELVDDQRSQYAEEDIDTDFFAEERKNHKGKRQ